MLFFAGIILDSREWLYFNSVLSNGIRIHISENVESEERKKHNDDFIDYSLLQ